MFTVALIGPDGAGKTTIGRRLEGSLPFPVKYLYMGVNVDSSNVLLPTTRILHALKRARAEREGRRETRGPGAQAETSHRGTSRSRQALASLRSIARLANRMGEEWFRQGLAWYHVHRGRLVIFDRHFYSDYYAHDVVRNGNRRSVARRVHGFVLSHLYPKPDLLILLDAPAEVLFARKPEGTLEALERRRREYLDFKKMMPGLAVVDVGQPEEEVASNVTRLILDFERERRR